MNAQRAAALVVCLIAAAAILPAQQRVDPRGMYERCYAIVPLVGAGTMADPKRPMYAPAPGAIDPASRTGIVAFTHVMSDDGKLALVEFVARDKAAFTSILADASVQSFLKGRDKFEDVQAAFTKYRKDFDLKKLVVVVP